MLQYKRPLSKRLLYFNVLGTWYKHRTKKLLPAGPWTVAAIWHRAHLDVEAETVYPPDAVILTLTLSGAKGDFALVRYGIQQLILSKKSTRGQTVRLPRMR